MLLSIILITGLIFSVLSMICFDWVVDFSDFWIVLVAFVVGIFASIFVIVFIIWIGSLFVDKNKDYVNPKKFYVRMVLRVCEFALTITRTKVNIRGLDKLPLDKKFLFITNHQSLFDSVATQWTLRGFNLQFVMKNSLLKVFLIGPYLHACGFIAIDRSNPREGIKAINKSVDRITNDVSSIVICPEGTRSGGYEMGEFHNGSFKIATKASCDIVLCAIQNTCKIMKRFPWKSTEIYFDVIEVIKPEDYEGKSTQEISDYAYKVIKEDLNELPKY